MKRQGNPWLCGVDAAKVLADLVHGHQLRCEVTDLEKLGAMRPVARCFDGVINIGMAWAFDRYLQKFDDFQALKPLQAVGRRSQKEHRQALSLAHLR